MALQGKYEFGKTGLEIADAYVRLREVTIRQKEFISFKVDVFTNNEKEPISPTIEFVIYCNDDDYRKYFADSAMKKEGSNIYVQCYKYLKSRAAFLEMLDV